MATFYYAQWIDQPNQWGPGGSGFGTYRGTEYIPGYTGERYHSESVAPTQVTKKAAEKLAKLSESTGHAGFSWGPNGLVELRMPKAVEGAYKRLQVFPPVGEASGFRFGIFPGKDSDPKGLGNSPKNTDGLDTNLRRRMAEALIKEMLKPRSSVYGELNLGILKIGANFEIPVSQTGDRLAEFFNNIAGPSQVPPASPPPNQGVFTLYLDGEDPSQTELAPPDTTIFDPATGSQPPSGAAERYLPGMADSLNRANEQLSRISDLLNELLNPGNTDRNPDKVGLLEAFADILDIINSAGSVLGGVAGTSTGALRDGIAAAKNITDLAAKSGAIADLIDSARRSPV